MGAQVVDQAIVNARRVWAEAIAVLDRTGDVDLADDLRRLSRELPSLAPGADIMVWSAPMDRAVQRIQELEEHEFAARVQWTFLDVLIVHGGGLPAHVTVSSRDNGIDEDTQQTQDPGEATPNDGK